MLGLNIEQHRLHIGLEYFRSICHSPSLSKIDSNVSSTENRGVGIDITSMEEMQ